MGSLPAGHSVTPVLQETLRSQYTALKLLRYNVFIIGYHAQLALIDYHAISNGLIASAGLDIADSDFSRSLDFLNAPSSETV